uniref:Uncharacterized protein n=1 Tax=Rhizophora mucronata TaxID=61149 RepID=A0A2P2QV67_RHIMU
MYKKTHNPKDNILLSSQQIRHNQHGLDKILHQVEMKYVTYELQT